MRLRKKVLFLLIIVLVASATLNGIYISMNMGPEVSLFRWVSFLVTVLVTTFLSNRGIKELTKTYRTGFLGEFFEFTLSLYPHLQDKDLAESLEVTSAARVVEQVKMYCENKVKTFGGVNIAEITQRPFSIKDNTVKSIKKASEGYTSSPVDHLIENFHDKADRIFITGPAGMGKSHLLRRYILTLLGRRSEDNITPIFLPAATYEETNITTWVINTCKKLYGSKQEDVEAILHHGTGVYLFIDGIDELPVHVRDQFIEKIYNDPLTSKHRMVISCRNRDFDLLKQQTTSFHYPVVCQLEALEPEAINTIVCRNLPDSKAQLIKGKIPPEIDTPLLISLFTRVASGSNDEELREMVNNQDQTAVTDRLWNQHIEMVFHEKKLGTTQTETFANDPRPEEYVKITFPLERIRSYASHLAGYWKNQHFTIKDFQPKALKSGWEIITYILATRVIIGVVASIGLGFLLGGTTRFIPAGLLCGFLGGGIYFLGNYPNYLPGEASPWWNRFWHSRSEFRQRAPKSVVFFLLLLFSLAPFFMLTGMRRDMGLNGTLAIADSIIAIFFTIIFTLVIGISDRQYGLDLDIRLVEKNNIGGNVRSGAKLGFRFALVLSLFVSALSLLFVHFQPGNVFSSWLMESGEFSGLGRFGFTVTTVFPIAFIIGFLLGLNDHSGQEMKERERIAQYDINYSMATTIRNTLLFWVLSTVLIGLLWGNTSKLLMGHGWDGMNRGFECAIGAGLFIALFWGGNDLIKTGVLRLMLYRRGDIPLHLSHLLRELEVLDIIQRQGAIFSFEHATLRSFLTKEDTVRTISKKILYGVPIGIFLLVCAVSVGKMAIRKSQFWDAPHRAFDLSAATDNIVIEPASAYVTFRRGGRVKITSGGLVSVGRIAGYVSPLGTEAGFFAMPIRDAFDVVDACRHGSIIYRDELEPEQWHCLFDGQAIPFLGQYRYRAKYLDTIQVSAGQRLLFSTNDLEPENNSHSFSLHLSYVDTPDQ